MAVDFTKKYTSMPKIAVLLVSYNGATYLKEQIISIQSQNNVATHIYLRDDKSVDGTVRIANELLDPDKISVNSKCTGSAANNFFLSLLDFEGFENYDYFAFSDQDDIWLPSKLEKATKQLSDQKASLYTSNLLIWNSLEDTRILLCKDDPQKKFDFLFEGGSAGCTYVFTKEFFKFLQTKLRTTSYLSWPDFSHDWFTYFMARQNNFPVINSSDAEILYRIHESNVHGQLNLRNRHSFLKRIQMVKMGWYLNNSEHYAKYLAKDSEEFYIYKLYCQNFFTRLKCLFKYNFKLMRSPKKFIAFFIMSIFFTGYTSKITFSKLFKRST